VAYLIDGNNFIGHSSSYDLKDPRAKYELVSKLLIFQRLKRTKIHLVFDGPLDPRFRTEKLQKKSFSVIYPAPDENADRVIEAIISKQSDMRRFYVVSSDREIRNFAKVKGANSLRCEEFDKELKAAIRKYKKSLEWQKKDTELSRFEVDQWLKIFKEKK
jgi:predicted RNA-binding protein with PIN domain